MSNISEIKQRARALAEKTDVNSVTPQEVGGIMYDLGSYGENTMRNGGTLGIRKVYASIEDMEADNTNPVDLWGDPIKKGNLVVIYDGANGEHNNEVYAFLKPGWKLATNLDAGYAMKAETDAKLSELASEMGGKLNSIMLDNSMYNIVNPAEIEQKVVLTDGRVLDGDSRFYNLSGFIPVDSKNNAVTSPFARISTSFPSFAVYDINKKFIRTISKTLTYQHEKGDAYVRINMNGEYQGTLYACYGNSYPDCFPDYGVSIDKMEAYSNNIIDERYVQVEKYISDDGTITSAFEKGEFAIVYIFTHGKSISLGNVRQSSVFPSYMAISSNGDKRIVKNSSHYEPKGDEYIVCVNLYAKEKVYANYGDELKQYDKYVVAHGGVFSPSQKIVMGGENNGVEYTGDSYAHYQYLGLSGQESMENGVVKKLTAEFASDGTAYICSARYDETHGYIDESAEISIEVSSGVNTYDINLPVSKGESVFVKGSKGVGLIVGVNLGEKPYSWIKGLFLESQGGKAEITPNVSCTLTWEIDVPQVTFKEKLIQIESDVNEKINDLSNKIVHVSSQLSIVYDESGKPYKLVVRNGELFIKAQIPTNVLVLAHSFGAIVTDDNSSEWERGMSSTRVETDWVHQFMNAVSPDGILERVKMVPWEQAFPNPSGQLPYLLDSHLKPQIDSIFIMCGANVNDVYKTYQYALNNFQTLIRYCKDKLPNVDVYVCSPGYTDESDEFNRGIQDAARATNSVYISTYSSEEDRMANFGDVMVDVKNGGYFIINSFGRANHPNDIWHLYMANQILANFNRPNLNKIHAISLNSAIECRTYKRWVEGGIVTLCTFGSSAPNVSVTSLSGKTIDVKSISLANQSWTDRPSRVPTFAVHFIMPDEDVTVVVK